MTLSHVTAMKQTGRGAPCLLRLCLVCLLQTDKVQATPPIQPAKFNSILSMGRASLLGSCSAVSEPWTALLYSGREVETISAPPLLDSANSPYSQDDKGSDRKGSFRDEGKNNETYRKLTVSNKRGNDRGYCLVCKNYSYGD